MTEEKVSTTVPLDWNEVWFTNCPMVSAKQRRSGTGVVS
jgi:hypothetical protein